MNNLISTNSNSNKQVSNNNIAQNWYQPAEIIILKRWLIYSIGANCLISFGEILRDNLDATYYTLAGMICLTLMRYILPNSTPSWNRWLLISLSIIAMFFALFSFMETEKTLYDIWSRAWLFIPPLLSIIWMFNARVKLWCSGGANQRRAQEGLRINSQLLPKYDQLGTHIFLLHGLSLILLPVLWVLDVSISPGNALGGLIADEFSLEHFEYILNNDAFYIWSKNSLIVSFGTVVTSLVLAVPAGYAFSRYNFRGRKESMRLFMLIQMFPGAIILVPYFMVMKTLGLLNSSIGLIIIYSVSALPISVWMLKGYFDTIPKELEEAAMLDGCNQFQIFYRIILPLSVTAISITALIGFLAAWNEFLLALVFNTSNEMFTLPVGMASLIPATGQRWGDFAAASVLVSTPIIVLFIYFQKSLISGLSEGAVKG